MGRRWSYILLGITLASVLAACGDHDLPDLSTLPGQGGTIFNTGSTGATTTPYAANTNVTDAQNMNSVRNTTTGGTASTTGSTSTTGRTPTTGSLGPTSTTGATTSATTTGGTGSTSGGSTNTTTTTSGSTPTTTTGGGGTGQDASQIAATTGGPGSTTYNSAQSNVVSGTVEGVVIHVASALFRDRVYAGQPALVIVLSDDADLCQTLTNGGTAKNSHQVRIVLYAGSAAWPPDGNYATDGSPTVATATFTFYDGNGNQTLNSSFASLHQGQVQLNDYAHGPGGDAQGSAQGLVGSQSDGISIQFNASWCAALP